MATLEIKNLTKRFGDFTAVDNLNLSIAQSEMIAILGGSGCGKTTTLRMIAGFTDPNEGSILVDGKDMKNIPPYKRNIGIFFQNYALFPHMTVFENVAFGLKLQKLPKAEIAHRVDEMLSLVKLENLNKRYPRELSGGQQQRVALARALVTRPQILLLDEPLSNLDAKLRVEMQVEIKRIQKALNITTIIVTHDHEEAISLADRVVVMNAGKILQLGSPREIYDKPNSTFVADFMGFSTFIKGTMGKKTGDKRQVLCGKTPIMIPASEAENIAEGQSCTLAIRSENIGLVSDTEGENIVSGKVKAVVYKGQHTRIELEGCFDEIIYPAITGCIEPEIGQTISVCLPADKLCVYSEDKI